MNIVFEDRWKNGKNLNKENFGKFKILKKKNKRPIFYIFANSLVKRDYLLLGFMNS